jgi:hypothetical protein
MKGVMATKSTIAQGELRQVIGFSAANTGFFIANSVERKLNPILSGKITENQ